MSLHLLAVTFDSPEPRRPAAFWAALLDRDVVDDGSGLLLPGDDTQVGLRFEQSDAGPVPARLHLHLTSTDLADQQATVDRALALGGRHVAWETDAADRFVVLEDPDGNAFCVIEPGNRFLAGTGFLGEVTCEGSREVGVFWSDLLGWPLVWDQDGETAVQSPAGGTKLAWGGPPVEPKVGRNAQRFELVGATAEPAERVDPDGNELVIRAQR